MVGKVVDVHTAVHRLAVDRESEARNRFMDKDVQKRKFRRVLPLHLEVDRGRKVVKRREKSGEESRVMRPESKDIIHVAKPQ